MGDVVSLRPLPPRGADPALDALRHLHHAAAHLAEARLRVTIAALAADVHVRNLAPAAQHAAVLAGALDLVAGAVAAVEAAIDIE